MGINYRTLSTLSVHISIKEQFLQISLVDMPLMNFALNTKMVNVVTLYYHKALRIKYEKFFLPPFKAMEKI